MTTQHRTAFPVFLELEIGEESTVDLWHQINRTSDTVTSMTIEARDLMRRTRIERAGSERVRFAKATVRECGFGVRPSQRALLARIKEHGHEPCKPNDAPALRLAIRDQRPFTHYCVAMELLVDRENPTRATSFRLGACWGRLLLAGGWGDDSVLVESLDSEIIFRLGQ